MEARATNETHIACKTGPLHCKQSTWRPRTILIHPAFLFSPPATLSSSSSSTKSQIQKRFGPQRWRWAAWCRTRSACPGSAGWNVQAGSACGPRCPREAFLAAVKETKQPFGIRNRLFLELVLQRRGSTPGVGEVTVKVKPMSFRERLLLVGCRVHCANLPYRPGRRKGTCQLWWRRSSWWHCACTGPRLCRSSCQRKPWGRTAGCRRWPASPSSQLSAAPQSHLSARKDTHTQSHLNTVKALPMHLHASYFDKHSYVASRSLKKKGKSDSVWSCTVCPIPVYSLLEHKPLGEQLGTCHAEISPFKSTLTLCREELFSKQTPHHTSSAAICLQAGEKQTLSKKSVFNSLLLSSWLHMHAVAFVPSSIIAGPNTKGGPSLNGNALDLGREMNAKRRVAHISCTVQQATSFPC